MDFERSRYMYEAANGVTNGVTSELAGGVAHGVLNEAVFDYFGVAQDTPRWEDWRWQYANRITGAEELSRIIPLADTEKSEISACLGGFSMAITPYYASLIDPGDLACPIRRQSVPAIDETFVYPWEKPDPLNEERDSPVPHIVHRYPDRVLFLVTRQCAMYCRHCIRKRHVGEEDFAIGEDELDRAVGYIKDTPRVRDVLISGGDPLTLGDSRLEEIIARLRAIEHVEVIRIGTRTPVTMPMRITPGLVAMLKKYHPLWINTHFNHPRELTPRAVRACADIADAGIPLGNQSVLLRGVNDDTGVMKELLLKLVRARVRPYYIYQCDLCEGIAHFRTRVETGVELIKSLTGNISGYAIPKFVIDAPNGGGKIPISPNNIVSLDDDKIVMRNYEGDLYSYPQPQSTQEVRVTQPQSTQERRL